MSDGEATSASPDDGDRVDDRGFQQLLERLSADYNFDFREYKEASLLRRIQNRMSQVHIDTFDAYTQYLGLHPDEHIALFNTILINVTTFFRDPEAWTVLREEIIPRIVEESGESRSLRIWSAGCSSGEEVYSLAILIAEHLGERDRDYSIKVYGTDIDEDALAAARHALYSNEDVKSLPTSLLERYFVRDGQFYRVRRDIRRWCIFGSHNLTHSPPLSHIDLLCCRNVLIYFGSDLQERILTRFHYSIREGGYLFLGRAESLLARSRLFTPLNLKWRIFQRLPLSMHGGLPAALVTAAYQEGEGPTAAVGRRETPPVGVRIQNVLDALPLAVMVIDATDTMIMWNPAAAMLFDIAVDGAVTRKFRDLDISYRIEGLRARIEDVKTRQTAVRMEDATFARRSGGTTHADIDVVPIFDGSRLGGVIVVAGDATEHARLKEQMTRVAEQHATAIEELQSTNEELETTNEELQSTNEELETTNEELQSTNEELETTVEELQAANSELLSVNKELEARGVELNELGRYHASVLDSVETPIAVLDARSLVKTWNQAAERMWGLRAEQATGRNFFTLPIGDIAQLAQPAVARVTSTGRNEVLAHVPYDVPGRASWSARVMLAPLKGTEDETIGVVIVAAHEERQAGR